ncbi:YtfJ family protein [Escherichia coli]|nr:hypothetical protein [Escherichia coli]
MSSRLIIALIIMLLAPGVQAHNFVTGKTVTPVYIQEGGELLLNSDDEIHYQKWNSTQLAGKVRIIQYIAGRKSAKKKNYSAAIFLIPICISFDTAEKRRYATYLILNRRFSFEF